LRRDRARCLRRFRSAELAGSLSLARPERRQRAYRQKRQPARTDSAQGSPRVQFSHRISLGTGRTVHFSTEIKPSRIANLVRPARLSVPSFRSRCSRSSGCRARAQTSPRACAAVSPALERDSNGRAAFASSERMTHPPAAAFPPLEPGDRLPPRAAQLQADSQPFVRRQPGNSLNGTAVIRGIATDGPMKGARVRGEYQVISRAAASTHGTAQPAMSASKVISPSGRGLTTRLPERMKTAWLTLSEVSHGVCLCSSRRGFERISPSQAASRCSAAARSGARIRSDSRSRSAARRSSSSSSCPR